MKRFFLLITLICFPFPTFAQQNIDSLKNELIKSSEEGRIGVLTALGREYIEVDEDKAEEYLAEALLLADKLIDTSGKAGVFFALGLLEKERYNSYKAISYLSRSIEIYNKLSQPRQLGIAYLETGNAYDDLALYDTALSYHIRALEQLEKTQDKYHLSNVLNNIGLEYWRWTKYSEALKYHRRALALREELGMSTSIGKSLNNIGIIYWRLGRFEIALDYYQRAYNLALIEERDYPLAILANNIGLIYIDMNNLDLAEEYFREGYSRSVDAGSDFAKAYSLQNIGEFFEKAAQLDSAEFYYGRALKIFDPEPNYIFSAVQVRNSLGMIYQLKGNYQKANDFYNKSLKQSQKEDYSIGLAYSYQRLGNLNADLGNNNIAEEYLTNALEVADDNSLRIISKDCSYDLYKFYENIDRHEGALKYYKQYSAIKDSIHSEASNERLAELHIQFETEKKELENESLKAEIELETDLRNSFILISVLAILVGVLLYSRFRVKSRAHKSTLEQKQKVDRLNTELEEANTTKDKFFSIISHDLKSPYTAIVGYSDMLDRQYDDLTEKERRTIIRDINITSKNSYNLLENLLLWAKTQQGQIKPEMQVLNAYDLNDSAAAVYGSAADNKDITIANKTPEKLYVNGDKEMLLTVIRNLISNAIKFSLRGGRIRLSAAKVDDEIRFEVADEGVGMNESQKNKLLNLTSTFSTGGTENEKGTGLGLILCRDFIEQHNGKIWAESEKDKGTTFYFTVSSAE